MCICMYSTGITCQWLLLIHSAYETVHCHTDRMWIWRFDAPNHYYYRAATNCFFWLASAAKTCRFDAWCVAGWKKQFSNSWALQFIASCSEKMLLYNFLKFVSNSSLKDNSFFWSPGLIPCHRLWDMASFHALLSLFTTPSPLQNLMRALFARSCHHSTTSSRSTIADFSNGPW